MSPPWLDTALHVNPDFSALPDCDGCAVGPPGFEVEVSPIGPVRAWE